VDHKLVDGLAFFASDLRPRLHCFVEKTTYVIEMAADGDYGEAPPGRRNRLKSVIQTSDGVTTTARGGGGGKQFNTWRQRADAEQGGGARKATRRQQEEGEDKPWEVPRGKHWGVS
jgi:hypothetical protein